MFLEKYVCSDINDIRYKMFAQQEGIRSFSNDCLITGYLATQLFLAACSLIIVVKRTNKQYKQILMKLK